MATRTTTTTITTAMTATRIKSYFSSQMWTTMEACSFSSFHVFHFSFSFFHCEIEAFLIFSCFFHLLLGRCSDCRSVSICCWGHSSHDHLGFICYWDHSYTDSLHTCCSSASFAGIGSCCGAMTWQQHKQQEQQQPTVSNNYNSNNN